MSRITEDRKEGYEKVAVKIWDNMGIVLKKKHITWKELAEKLNADPMTLSVCKANPCNPSFGNVIDIACILNVVSVGR